MLRLPGRLAVWAALASSSVHLPMAARSAAPAARWPVCVRRLLWTGVTAAGRCGDPPLTEAEWRARLTPHQFAVTRLGDTEPPYSGHLPAAASADDQYGCVCCGAPLFRAGDKFESGSGWPSFTAAAGSAPDGGPDGTNVATRRDVSHGMVREEALCRSCGAHLGHVFNDGPRPTGLRYCINSVALTLLDGAEKDGEKGPAGDIV